MGKIRLDLYLTGQGMAPSREKARAYIMEGIVYVNGQKEDKPGCMVREDAKIELRGKQLPYVSRGGYKLEKALKEFPIRLEGKVCMDVGASTGGFTDCMLMQGASKVYAVDVGYGQLAWKLRSDPRVINLERTNARNLSQELVPEPLDFVSVDASFISLKLLLPVIKQFLKPQAELVCLIKPQFEAGREKVGKKGVVRELTVHVEVVREIYRFCKELGLIPAGVSFSPIKGPEGNIEYLIYLASGQAEEFPQENIEGMVEASHQQLT